MIETVYPVNAIPTISVLPMRDSPRFELREIFLKMQEISRQARRS